MHAGREAQQAAGAHRRDPGTPLDREDGVLDRPPWLRRKYRSRAMAGDGGRRYSGWPFRGRKNGLKAQMAISVLHELNFRSQRAGREGRPLG